VKDDIIHRLDALRNAVDTARSVPMSASVMINRSEFLDLLSELESTIDTTLSHATEVLGERDAFVDTGRIEAIELLREAEKKSEDLVSDTDVYRLAQLRAEEITTAAAEGAARLRAETEEYVEAKLANFEDTVERTVASIRSGRAQLKGPDAPELDEEMRQETDEYVEEKLAAFEDILVSTVELVRRGRAQLTGGHSHALGDDTDVDHLTLPDHLQR
jgi:cell division septum initiation protein DivIVA